ncbi:MAG: S1C family serine protease [Acidobacteria bacterium]|nr:S1C family serine protease [Acidobacteriota bacterium]
MLTVVGVNSQGSVISQGSGFILTSDGLAGTNYHVLKGVSHAVVECCNGRTFDLGSIEGADLARDLIVFQVYVPGTKQKPRDLPHVNLASSTKLSVGERIIAVGSPEGLTNTVTDGILSAIRESDSVRYLQITAPISPGSSGGPVLNAAGEMVGVATFQVEKGQNLNFAVAADHIRPLVEQHFQLSLPEFQRIVRQLQREQRGSTSRSLEIPSDDEERNFGPITGQFGGIVHNKSANLSAEFALLIRDDHGVLSGCFLVAQPLFGSGPLSGFTVDSDISFDVTSAIGTISFTGKMLGPAINGEYTVERAGGGTEEGTFTVRKLSSAGPRRNFDPTKCPTDAEVNQ